MSIDSIADWEGLRQVARIARITLDAVAALVRPGVTTAELDATAARMLAAHGARSAPALVYGFFRARSWSASTTRSSTASQAPGASGRTTSSRLT